MQPRSRPVVFKLSRPICANLVVCHKRVQSVITSTKSDQHKTTLESLRSVHGDGRHYYNIKY